MIAVAVAVLLAAVLLWRRTRKARQRRAAADTLHAALSTPNTDRGFAPHNRFRGRRGMM